MKLGNNPAETLKLNNWGVGDILQKSSCKDIKILITAIGDGKFLCKWMHSGKWTQEEHFGPTFESFNRWNPEVNREEVHPNVWEKVGNVNETK